MSGIGRETERTAKNNRNEDIDSERTQLNFYFKKSDSGLSAQWKSTMKELNATFKEKGNSVAFEGMIITSDNAFFERLGYVPGLPPPPEVKDFFESAYKFALYCIGYHSTDANILSAVVHYDETTPHLQLYYLPLVDTAKKKVYALTEDGKVARNEKGSPIQLKEKDGKSVYEYVRLEQPKLCSSDFWAERGGQHSYGNMQDEFYDRVSVRYGLERGEVGSNRKHTTKYEWQMKQRQAELAEADDKIKRNKIYIAEAEGRLTQTKFMADIAEARQAHAQREAQRLEQRQEQLQREVAPLQAAADVAKEYTDGKKKPDKRDVPVLAADNARHRQELEYSTKDQQDVFQLYQRTERERQALDKDAKTLRELREQAPDKLKEALAVAEQRKAEKHSTLFKGSGNGWSK